MRTTTLFLMVTSCLLTVVTYAQVGIGTSTPEASAQLDVSASNRGFLPPRVALVASNSASPLTSPATGLLVFNTATTGDVAPGYYYNSGTKAAPLWIRLSASTDSNLYILKPSGASSNDLLSFDGTNWVAKSIFLGTTGSDQPVSNLQPYLVLNFCISLAGIYPSRNSAEPILGEIDIFGFDFAPRNYAKCDGQLLPISQNSALFSLLGTYYGGDGRVTFALPDLRGRVPMHNGTGNGLTPRPLAQQGGAETFQLTVNNLPAHTHTVIYE
jgi:microcystin-dependent protein